MTRLACTTAVAVLLGTTASAAIGGETAAGTSAAARSTSILGAAWHADNSPVPNARLRLRNVQTGRIEATAVANEQGQFTFNGVESGTYVIELVSDAGKVLAVSHTLTVAPGETIATFVRLGNKVPWFKALFAGGDGFFSNAASVVSSTAASTGVTAIAPEEVRCVSPPCN